MGGLGLCLCCKEDKLLTEHHEKEIKEKVMICRDCHNVIEEYLKMIEKYSKLILRDHQPLVDKDSSSRFKNDDNTSSEPKLPPLKLIDNEHDSASDTALPDEQVQALKDLVGEYKKSDKTSSSGTSDDDSENDDEEKPRKRQKGWIH